MKKRNHLKCGNSARKLRSRLLAVFILLAGIAAPMSGHGADSVHDDVLTSGAADVQYYTALGAPADASNYAVSTSKSVTQAKDSHGVALENQFDVSLSVETSTDYSTIEVTKDAAVTLVLDMSDSMISQCANCGRIEGASVGVSEYDNINAHRTTETKYGGYYCQETIDRSLVDMSGSYNNGYYKDTNGDGKCDSRVVNGYVSGVCGKTGDNHIPPHNFLSRLDEAQKTVTAFLRQYIDSGKGAKRYLSIVVFSNTAKTQVVENWSDISGLSDAVIQTKLAAIFQNNIGKDTCTTGGMSHALNQTNSLPSGIPARQSSVILLTDGLPGEACGDYSTDYTTGPFLQAYTEAKAYNKTCEDASGYITKDSCNSIAAYAFKIRDTGASLYTISFDSGAPNNVMRKYLPGIMQKFATESYSAGNISGLEGAFKEIITSITELRPNIVTDVLPEGFHLNADSFAGNGKTSAEELNGTISWRLSNVTPDSVDSSGHRRYTLSYRVTLDNQALTYADGLVKTHPLNAAAPTFRYQMFDGSGIPGATHTVAFNIPQVRSTAATQLITKVDGAGAAIEGNSATFGLYTDVEPADITPTTTCTSVQTDATGSLSLHLPSGHQYVLVETIAPGGYELDDTPLVLPVRWGQVSVPTAPSADGAYLIHNYPTGATKPITVTKVWEDHQDVAFQYQTVFFQIYAKGAESTPLASGRLSYADRVSDDGYTWQTDVRVPLANANGVPITEYVIKETPSTAYTLTNTESGTDAFTLYNQMVTKKDVTVTKNWVEPARALPLPQNVLLPEDGLQDPNAPVDPGMAVEPEAPTDPDLTIDPGMSVDPDAPADSDVPIDPGVTVQPPSPQTINSSPTPMAEVPAVELVHPSVSFTLYLVSGQTETAFETPEILAAGSADGATVSFKDVPIYDGSGQPYGYRVEETVGTDGDSYYFASAEPTADGFAVTNKHSSYVEYALRIDRVYHYSLDGVAAAPQTVTGVKTDGTYQVETVAFTRNIHTNDYLSFLGKRYSFTGASLTVGAVSPRANAIVAGDNAVQVDTAGGEYVVTLHYSLNETTSTPVVPPVTPEVPPVTPVVPPVTPVVPPVTPVVPPVTPVVPPVTPVVPPVTPEVPPVTPVQPGRPTPPPGFDENAPHLPPADAGKLDPNSPDSPDSFVLIDENDVPLGYYTKQVQPDGEVLYIDEEGVPLGGWPEIPQTADASHIGLLTSLALLSGLGTLMLKEPRYQARRLHKKN